MQKYGIPKFWSQWHFRIKILLIRSSKWGEIKPRSNPPLKRRHGTL